MGFPHVGTVDTRHNAPGTIKAELSAGAGTAGVIYPGMIAAGAAAKVDSYLTPRLSLATSAQMLATLSLSSELAGNARVGLRLRPNQKLSLGMGVFGTASNRGSSSEGTWGCGGDFEVATSRVKPEERFVSHAWRLSLGHSTDEYLTGTLLGDWSRSRPTKNKDIRFSYGLNYGINLGTSTENDMGDEQAWSVDSPTLDFAYFVGVHIGMQWGGKWGSR